NLGQVELRCQGLCSRDRDRQYERRRNACADDYAVYRLSHFCLRVLAPWDVRSSRHPNAFFPKCLPQSTAEATCHFAAVPNFGRDRSEADIPRASGGSRSDKNDPEPTKAPSKSRSAVGLPQCYLPLRSTGEMARETSRVHHA